jgi:hypothetical protein
MNDSIFNELDQLIDIEADKETDNLEQRVDESTPDGDIILDEGRTLIEIRRGQRKACNNTLSQHQSLNDEINPGASEYSDFVSKHGLGLIDEDGYFQQESDGEHI